MGGVGGGSGAGIVIQSQLFSNASTSATLVGTFPLGITAGNSILVTGFISASVAGASVTLSAADDKGSTGWQVDAVADPGGGNSSKVFIASCLAPIAGATIVTITVTGGVAVSLCGMLEVHGVTGRGTPKTHGSAGAGETGPVSITNAAANTSPRAITLHAFTNAAFLSNLGMTAAPTTNSFTTLQVNQNFATNTPGICGYYLDTTTVTDSVVNNWTQTSSSIAQVLMTFELA